MLLESTDPESRSLFRLGKKCYLPLKKVKITDKVDKGFLEVNEPATQIRTDHKFGEVQILFSTSFEIKSKPDWIKLTHMDNNELKIVISANTVSNGESTSDRSGDIVLVKDYDAPVEKEFRIHVTQSGYKKVPLAYFKDSDYQATTHNKRGLLVNYNQFNNFKIPDNEQWAGVLPPKELLDEFGGKLSLGVKNQPFTKTLNVKRRIGDGPVELVETVFYRDENGTVYRVDKDFFWSYMKITTSSGGYLSVACRDRHAIPNLNSLDEAKELDLHFFSYDAILYFYTSDEGYAVNLKGYLSPQLEFESGHVNLYYRFLMNGNDYYLREMK